MEREKSGMGTCLVIAVEARTRPGAQCKGHRQNPDNDDSDGADDGGGLHVERAARRQHSARQHADCGARERDALHQG